MAGSISDEIVQQSVDAIIVTDPEYRVRVWSPAAERLYGIPDSTALGRSLRDLVETSNAAGGPIDTEASRRELEAKGVWRQHVIQRPEIGPFKGRDIIIDSIVTLLRGPDGATIAVFAVNRDVTTTMRLELELAALGSLVVAADRARTKNEVADAALDILCRATGADAGLVTSTETTYEATAQRGLQQATIDVIVRHGRLGGELATALEASDAYISADVAQAPLREDVRAALVDEGIRHVIVVALRLSGRLTGIVALGWRQESPREPSRAMLRQASALVASSLENARLLTAVENGLGAERTLNRRMQALVELTRLPQAAGSGGMHGLVRDVAAIVGADGAIFAEREGDHLAMVAVDRLDPISVEPLLNQPFSSLPIASRLAEGSSAAVLIEINLETVSAAGAAASAENGFRSIAAFPIRDDATLVGILFTFFRRPVEDLEIDERTLDAIGRVLDISFANRRLREGIAAGERRYRELFESSPDALLVQSIDQVVVDANPAALRLYGEALIGHLVDDLVETDADRPGIDVVDPRGFIQYTGIGRRLDGSTFPEEVDLRPIDVAGEQRLLVIVRDLTERSRLQGELVQAQKMEAIGLLVAGVAHELNNPLASIVAFSQLIRTDPKLPADLRSQADLLVQEANRTRAIVQNLLDFARQRPPERVETELRPLIESVLGLQSYVFTRNRLQVEVSIPEDLPLLWMDRSQMQQVLINLTVNAAQAIHEAGRPGTIGIEASSGTDASGPTVRIAISDDGPGVPPEMVDRLFVPFVTTKPPGQGTGLGLSVSFGIVASHGGTLRHQPNPAGGATFVIELPVGRVDGGVGLGFGFGPFAAAPGRAAPTISPAPRPPSAAAALTTEPAPADAPRSPALPDRAVRVLVLDDEPSIRDFLGRVLARSGYEPVLATTGAAALEVVRTDPPDAILCDHRMAGMSGTEFHAAVTEIAPALGRRFAFMSGDVLNPELHDFAAARGVRLLAKPFDIVTVAAIVATLLADDPA